MIDFWLITGAGIVNGLNVCALGLMLTFVGYLLVFGGKKRSDLLNIGVVYIGGIFISYLLVGLIFYQLAFYLQNSPLSLWLPKIVGIMLLFFAGVQIKQVLQIGGQAFGGGSKGVVEKVFFSLIGKASLPMAFLLGFLTTGVATPCIMPAYVGVASVLVRSGLSLWKVLVWFLYYNFLFILPMIVVLVLVYGGKSVTLFKELGHNTEKWGRMVMAILLIVIGLWLLR
jgi:cytochrome c-type biogenesis protein